MASVRKQKPTMEPRMPTRGRIHILEVWREQSLNVTVSVVSGRRSSDVGHSPHYNRVLNLQAGKSRRAQLLPSLPRNVARASMTTDRKHPAAETGPRNARPGDNGLSIAITKQPTEISTTERRRRGGGSRYSRAFDALKPAATFVERTTLPSYSESLSNRIHNHLPTMSRPEDTL